MTIYTGLWIGVFIVSLIVELATANALVSIWFAIGAMVSGILSLFHLSFLLQCILFFIVSAIALVAIRPLAGSYLRGNTVPTNSDALIGVRTHLIKEITLDNYGEVIIKSIHWNATTADGKEVPKGALVEVLAIEGSKLIVKEC